MAACSAETIWLRLTRCAGACLFTGANLHETSWFGFLFCFRAGGEKQGECCRERQENYFVRTSHHYRVPSSVDCQRCRIAGLGIIHKRVRERARVFVRRRLRGSVASPGLVAQPCEGALSVLRRCPGDSFRALKQDAHGDSPQKDCTHHVCATKLGDATVLESSTAQKHYYPLPQRL